MADEDGSQPRDAGKPWGIERAGAIVAELADAFRAALIAVAEEQEAAAAQHISAVAEATRCAASSLDQSGESGIAKDVAGAAERIDDLARVVRERNWREIRTATATCARRRPGLFNVGAVALGFLVGRLFTSPAGPAEPSPTASGDDGVIRYGGDGAESRQQVP
jgi:hypothetical protein